MMGPIEPPRGCVTALFLGVVCLPFGLWKIVEIVHWLFTHVSIGVTP